jgi:hypothetical protein
VEFAKTLWPDWEQYVWKSQVRLEEVEQSEINGSKAWLITLSIPKPDVDFLSVERQYKVFSVHGETGEVLSMKIREFAGVHV